MIRLPGYISGHAYITAFLQVRAERYGLKMTVLQRYSRVRKKGQITIPVEFRDRLGLKEGDIVAFVETEAGLIISPQESLASYAMNQVGKALKEQNVSLEEMIETGREERAAVIEEIYGLSDDR